MGINAFQHNAFQQTVGHVAFQELTTVVVITGGGRRYNEGLEKVYRHIAATQLGKKGGLTNAKKFY